MRPRRLLAALALGLGLLPGLARAHANLERADPLPGSAVQQAPSQLRLFFSEPPDGGFSRVSVLDARREQVDRGDSHVSPTDPREMDVSLNDRLPDGVYTVSWKTLSAVDGHVVNGAYPIVIGALPATGVGSAAPAVSSEARFAPRLAQTAPGAVARDLPGNSAALPLGGARADVPPHALPIRAGGPDDPGAAASRRGPGRRPDQPGHHQ
jgi:methionine-rich copper-binding protein CopC